METGDWQAPGFESPAPAQGADRLGEAWPGRAGRGGAGQGEVVTVQAGEGQFMNSFQPLGEQARWRTIYEILHQAPIDGIVTYEQIGEALALDPGKDRHAIQMAARRAAAELETADNRAVDAVPNEGYRIVAASEHLTLARRHQKKAGKSLARGQSKVVHVDMSEIDDPEVRKALEITAQAFALQMDFNRRFAVRQSQLERAVREITGTQAADRKRSDEEVAKLRERIERLEHGE